MLDGDAEGERGLAEQMLAVLRERVLEHDIGIHLLGKRTQGVVAGHSANSFEIDLPLGGVDDEGSEPSAGD